MGAIFAILSAAIFALTNYIDKFLLEKHNISPTVITIYSGGFAFAVGLLILLVTGFYPIDLKSLLIILASGFLTCIYILPYYKALALDETSIIVPLLQTYPFFVLILSLFLLGETLSSRQYIGSFLLIAAGIILSLKKNKNIFKLRKSFFYIMLSSFLFACAQVLYKFGVTKVPFWQTLPYEGLGIALGALTVLLYKNNWQNFKKQTKKFKSSVYLLMGINESAYVLARYAGYFAISLISVSLVSVLAETQPLFVLLFGIGLSLFFPHIIKEVLSKQTLGLKFLSVVLIIVGSYFIFF